MRTHRTTVHITSRRRTRRAAQAAAAGLVAAGVLALPLAQVASAHPKGHSTSRPTVTAAMRGHLGTILVTSSGAALYRYTPDKPNRPTCTGGCAAVWPPLLLPAGTTTVHGGHGVQGLSSVKATAGRRQVTYHRMPLYRFADDHGTSVNGQGLDGIWYVVHPSGAGATAPSGGKQAGHQTGKRSTGNAGKQSPPTTSGGSGYGY